MRLLIINVTLLIINITILIINVILLIVNITLLIINVTLLIINMTMLIITFLHHRISMAIREGQHVTVRIPSPSVWPCGRTLVAGWWICQCVTRWTSVKAPVRSKSSNIFTIIKHFSWKFLCSSQNLSM